MERRTAVGRALALASAILVAAPFGAAAQAPGIVITNPANGTFSTAAAISVQGMLEGIESADIVDVQINDVSVLPLGPGETFSATVPLDPVDPTNSIVAKFIGSDGSVLRDRITIIFGDSVTDGQFSAEAVVVRVSESGLDQLESEISADVPLNLPSLVPPGTLVVDDFCYQDSFLGCIGTVDATISAAPPPALSGPFVDIDSMTNFVAGDVTLQDFAIRGDVVSVAGIAFSCAIDASSPTALISGDFGLDPSASNPEKVDATQLGSVNTSIDAFSHTTDCEGFLQGSAQSFIDLYLGNLRNIHLLPGLRNALNAVDAEGNTPVAAALETALSRFELGGPTGGRVGVSLAAPLFNVFEDVEGITMASDARVTASMPDPSAVDLSASYHVDQAFPSFGPLAPNGLAYDVALWISASAMNQLLKAESESGLLIISMTEFDFGSGPEPITSGLLSGLLPAFALRDPAELLRFDLRPEVAPFVVGQAGPTGEPATLKVPHLELSIVPIGSATPLLQAVTDVRIGLDVGLVGGMLAFSPSAPGPSEIGATLLEDPLQVSQAGLDALLPGVIAHTLMPLSDSLGSFPIPVSPALQLGLVDVDWTGDAVSIFFELRVPQQVPALGGAALGLLAAGLVTTAVARRRGGRAGTGCGQADASKLTQPRNAR